MESQSLLHRLSFFEGPVQARAIDGGMTNQNFRVEEGGRTYFVRFASPLPELGIFRANEILCQRSAAVLGLGPKLLHVEEGVVISEWVEARSMTKADFERPENIKRFAEALLRLHRGGVRSHGEFIYFSVFQTLLTYRQRAQELGAALPDEISDEVEKIIEASAEVSPFVPTLCHNDLLPANIMDDGERLWLVDWEYAGFGNALFDVAAFAANAELSEANEKRWLEAMRLEGSSKLLADLRLHKGAGLLRETLWAFIQSKQSTLDVDYKAYAQQNWQEYQNSKDRA